MSPPETSAFGLIRSGSFARLWWAGAIGSAGDWITIFATLAVASEIGGGTGTLVALLSRILPGLLFGAAAGVFADRIDRKKLIVIADVGRAALVPFLAFAGDLWTIVLINLGLELLAVLGQTPRAAVIPAIVHPRNIVTANSLTMGAAYGTIPLGAMFNFVIGFLPAVTLFGLVPAANASIALAFFLDSLTFLLSGVIVMTLPSMAAPAVRENDDGEGALARTWHDVRNGATYLWRRKPIRRVILGLATALFGGGTITVIGLQFVDEVLAADQRGFFAVVAALGFGAAAGIAGVSLASDRLARRDLAFAVATIFTGFGLAAGSLTSTVAGAAAWLAVFGFGAGAAYVMGFSYLHEEVDDEMRGRVFAALFTLMRIGLFISMAIAVPLAGFFRTLDLPGLLGDGSRMVLLTGGFTITLAGLGTLWSVRGGLERPHLGDASRRIIAATASQWRVRDDADDEENTE
ncbi:MAG: MFS transporter [Acidimicrobiia bacterium]|nr:MFS transporter [Acidimicrobiia bacterium]